MVNWGKAYTAAVVASPITVAASINITFLLKFTLGSQAVVTSNNMLCKTRHVFMSLSSQREITSEGCQVK
jgi:hypothetical protein